MERPKRFLLLQVHVRAVSAGCGDGLDADAAVGEHPLDRLKPAFLDFRGNRPSEFAEEAVLERPQRDVQRQRHPGGGDAGGRVLGDERKRPLHHGAARAQETRRLAHRHADHPVLRRGERAAAFDAPPQLLHRQFAAALPVGQDARDRRIRVLADEGVVVAAEHGDVVRHRESGGGAGVHHLPRDGVERGEDGARPGQGEQEAAQRRGSAPGARSGTEDLDRRTAPAHGRDKGGLALSIPERPPRDADVRIRGDAQGGEVLRRAVRHGNRVQQDVAAAGDQRRGVHEHPRHLGESAAEVGDAAGRRVVVFEDEPVGHNLGEDVVERRRERMPVDDVEPPAELPRGADDARKLVAPRPVRGRTSNNYVRGPRDKRGRPFYICFYCICSPCVHAMPCLRRHGGNGERRSRAHGVARSHGAYYIISASMRLWCGRNQLPRYLPTHKDKLIQ